MMIHFGAIPKFYLALCLLLTWRAGVEAQGHPLATAQARQQNTHTLAAELRIEEFVVKKVPNIEPDRKFDVGFADGDLRYESINSLFISGEKVRYEFNHPLYRVAKGYPYQKALIVVWDGAVAKELFPRGLGRDDTPIGLIRQDPSRAFPNYLYWTPLIVHFRGLDSTHCRYDLNRLKETGQTIPIEGIQCHEYAIEHEAQANQSIRFYIHPQRGSIQQITSQKANQPTYQIAINYREDPAAGWVPWSWTIKQFSDAGILHSYWKVSVKSLQVNSILADPLFNLEFPEGCRVTDENTNRHYRIGADGARQQFEVPGEMVSPPTPDEPTLSWYGRNKLLVISCIALLFLGLFLLRRKRRPFVAPAITTG